MRDPPLLAAAPAEQLLARHEEDAPAVDPAVRFGVAGALRLSGFFHIGTGLFFALVGIAAHLGIIYWLGFSAVAVVLVWEHRIVTPTDLSRINKAFFNLNAYVSLGYFVFTAADVLLLSKNGIGG